MSEPIFKVDDFCVEGSGGIHISVYDAVERANAKLEKLLGPVVYAHRLEEGYMWFGESDKMGYRKFSARLFNIQKIERPPCEHEPEPNITFSARSNKWVCRKCGVNMKVATWAVDE